MSRPLPSPIRSVRVRRHVFGRARAGYTTLGCAPSLTVTERRELECFEFGETIEWAGDPKSTEELRFLLRPIAAGIALTRVAPGPPDPSNRPTLLLRSLIFETLDASVIASQLAALLSDPEYFEFEGTEDGPVEIEIEKQSPAPVRSDLLEVQQTATARRGAVLIPLAQTSFSEIAGLVAQVYARTGSLPRVVYRPGSDELDCDVMVIDDHCRRGNASQLRINYPDGRSEAPRPSGKRILGSNFDPRSVIVPREIELSSMDVGSGESMRTTFDKAMAGIQVITVLLVGAIIGSQFAPSSPANRANEEMRRSLAAITTSIGGVTGEQKHASGEIAELMTQVRTLVNAHAKASLAAKEQSDRVVGRLEAIDASIAAAKTRSDAFDSTVLTARASLEELAKRIGALETTVSTIKTGADVDQAMRSALTRIDTAVEGATTKLEAIQGEIKNIDADVKDHYNKFYKWTVEEWTPFKTSMKIGKK